MNFNNFEGTEALRKLAKLDKPSFASKKEEPKTSFYPSDSLVAKLMDKNNSTEFAKNLSNIISDHLINSNEPNAQDKLEEIIKNYIAESITNGLVPMNFSKTIDREIDYEYLNTANNTFIDAVLQCMKDIRDSVVDPRKRTSIIYPCDVMMIIIILAKLNGMNIATEIASYYRLHNEELQDLIPGMPDEKYKLSASTINNFIGMIDPKIIEKFFRIFFGKVRTTLDNLITTNNQRERPDFASKNTISFDGQEITNSFRRGESSRRKKGAISVTTFNSTTKTALAYKTVAKKNQETEAFLSMIPNLEVRGSVIMCDALNSRKNVSKMILDCGADYLLSLKNNGGNKELRNHIEAIFNREEAVKQEEIINASPYVQKDHGRIDTTLISILPAKFLDPRIKNPHDKAGSIVKYTKISCKIINGNQVESTTTTRYYLSSLEATKENAEQIKYSILDYWFIESHHGILDNPNVLNQDSTQSCRESFLSNTVGLNKITYNILSWIKKDLESKGKKKYSYRLIQSELSMQPVIVTLEYLARYYQENTFTEEA